jgi:formylglycine-generating enzyme required for sulfatase activity
VLGNAAEWVNDWYNPDAYASSPATDPRGPSSGTERVVRGGSYQDSADGLRVSRRNRMPPGQSAPDVGFRCVIDAR